MPYLNSVKPWIATILLALYLPVPFYLLVLHGFHNFWRRMGLRSFAVLLTLYTAMVVAVFAGHSLWSWRPWSWPPALEWVAGVPLAIAVWLAYVTYRTIEPGTLHLARQLRPTMGRTLITVGILGRIRHPRYLMFSLIALGNVLLTAYPLVAASFLVCVAVFAVVIRLEERELLAYFGDAFRSYQHDVPAFIPRLFRRARSAPD